MDRVSKVKKKFAQLPYEVAEYALNRLSRKLQKQESNRVGKPFLASDVDGLREVVKGAGILFSHGDSKAVANEIMTLENSPEKYRSVADACRQRAAQFDISKMVDAYAELYKTL